MKGLMGFWWLDFGVFVEFEKLKDNRSDGRGVIFLLENWQQHLKNQTKKPKLLAEAEPMALLKQFEEEAVS